MWRSVRQHVRSIQRCFCRKRMQQAFLHVCVRMAVGCGTAEARLCGGGVPSALGDQSPERDVDGKAHCFMLISMHGWGTHM